MFKTNSMIFQNKNTKTFHVLTNEKIENGKWIYEDSNSNIFSESEIEFLSEDKFKFEFIKKLENHVSVSNYEWKLFFYVSEYNEVPFLGYKNFMRFGKTNFYIKKLYSSILLLFNRKSIVEKMYIQILLKNKSFSEKLTEIFLNTFKLELTKPD